VYSKFIITLFNVDNVLLWIIYQLNFNVFIMLKEYHVTSRYVQRSVLSTVSRNRGRSWNARGYWGLPVRIHIYMYIMCPALT